ncbi:hypothetical protein LshimejAT787_1101100 [Lyophyllum shimeji]|uniref:Uncharacterized protein n=1 Tax=Lyophyllum shimeji TaxID=47721 RepID=A0A9P3PU97_LYOSH|nr:hypothetical protein LshimejAT787_1101100 [Lyophyllum shimeji]
MHNAASRRPISIREFSSLIQQRGLRITSSDASRHLPQHECHAEALNGVPCRLQTAKERLLNEYSDE